MQDDIRDFFHAVLSPKGFPCLAFIRAKPKSVSQEVCDSIDDLINHLYANIDKYVKDKVDIYFCISTLHKKWYIDDLGRSRSRTQENVLHTKVLVLDIDVDPSGEKHNKPAYRSIQEAKDGLDAFCAEVALPNPYVICSGYGLHVYWPMQDCLSPEDWVRLANSLLFVASIVDPRLVVDPTRTKDCSSLLRVPGTANFKRDYPSRVTIDATPSPIFWAAQDYAFRLKAYQQKRGLFEDAPQAASNSKKLVDLSVAPSFEPVSLGKLVKSCAWVADYWRRRATKEVSYPEWYAMLNMIAYHVYIGVKDETQPTGYRRLTTEEAAHYVSKDYPGYDPRETSAKLKESLDAGALMTRRTCASLAMINPNACNRCPLRPLGIQHPFESIEMAPMAEKITVESKTLIGDVEVEKKLETLPPPPEPYYIGEDDAVYRKVQREDGQTFKTVKIYDYRLIPVQRIKDADSGNFVVEIEMALPNEQPFRFIVNNEDFHDEKVLIKELSKKGAMIQKQYRQWVADYLIKYIKVIQESRAAAENYESFGWKHIHSPDPRFVLYDAIIKSDGIWKYRNVSRNLVQIGKHASSSGQLDKCIEVLRTYEGIPNCEPYIIALMLAFGAPLLAFMNEFGFIYNLIGPGGEGKSSAMYLASSIWGMPTASHGLQHDTVNALLDKIGIFCNLPFMYDEITNIEPKILSDFAYTISNGRAKDRLHSTGLRQTNNRIWQTVVLTSSNYSLYGKLGELKSGNNAHAYRILEFKAPVPNNELRLRMDAIKDCAKSNHGILGKEWAYYLVSNFHKVWEAVKLTQANIQQNATSAASSKERFWYAAQVIVQVACSFTKAIGWHNYNADQLADFINKNLPRTAINTVVGDAVSKLNDYLTYNANAIVRVMDDVIQPFEQDMKGITTIMARLEGKSNEVLRGFIPVVAMQRWCRLTQTDYSWLRSELKRKGIIKRTTRRKVGAGTKLFSVPADCWELNMQHPELTGKKDVPEDKVVPLHDASGIPF